MSKAMAAVIMWSALAIEHPATSSTFKSAIWSAICSGVCFAFFIFRFLWPLDAADVSTIA
jgi:hypothetical protein